MNVIFILFKVLAYDEIIVIQQEIPWRVVASVHFVSSFAGFSDIIDDRMRQQCVFESMIHVTIPYPKFLNVSISSCRRRFIILRAITIDDLSTLVQSFDLIAMLL